MGGMLQNKKILIGVTGSIAAYKIPLLVRLLVKAGANVKVIMTVAATEFVSPLALATVSKNEVLVDIASKDVWANHVQLGRWADVMLLAPLSCNTLAKMANGLCDNLLMAVYLSATCPVIVAPAMDEDMYHHPSTKANTATLQQWGTAIIPAEKGELASGLFGYGRMAEPETMVQWLQHFFATKSQLANKKVVITAGPTYEAIDPVRFIGNRSSGKMGIAIAKEMASRGATVTLILGPVAIDVPANITTVHVQTAQQMFEATTAVFNDMDIAIMSAAVADYAPISVATEKIKKLDTDFSIQLQKTTDILQHIGTLKKANQLLVGFALETNNEKAFALKKLQTKNADIIILNSLNDAGAGFGHNTNKITIFDKNGGEQQFETKSKTDVAIDIVNSITKFIA
jgi:phosphopantothenoylcysteine decarboxylase / phosphopantothenate---cysteine ligase